MNNPNLNNEGNLRWYQGITKYQWMVLAVASVGWIFDVYEGQLFAIYKADAIKGTTSGLSDDLIDRYVQYAMAAFLVGGAVGGLLFGVLADSIGRRKTMVISILVYSIFTGLHYFATDWWQIVALRFLVAMGVGGEWAIAASLVAEVFPKRSRAAASGIFHASSVVGVVLAAGTRLVLADMSSGENAIVDSENAWRWAFLVGFIPALLVLWVRASVKESERWENTKNDSTKKSGSLSELLSNPTLRRNAMVGLGLASIGMASYWAIVPWAKNLVDGLAGDGGEVGTVAYMVMNLTGSLIGLLAFAPIATKYGRRKAFIFYHVGAFISVPAAFLISSTVAQAFVLLSIMSFFVVGMHAGYAIYFPELFPTHLRATGASFCFNVGRLLSAVMLILRGRLREIMGLNYAVSAMSILFLLGILLLFIAPETKDSDLE
jgi:MFS family permease